MSSSRHSRFRAVISVISSLVLVLAAWTPAWAQQQGAQTLSRSKLEQLAAPVALYPDRLLTHVLMASTYPLDVVQAARWRRANPGLKGSRLEAALRDRNWDESVKALTAFPDVLRLMNEKLDWTEQLGEAFLAQEDELLAAVQDLRRRAETAGNLKSSREQRVTRSGSGETRYVLIEPADPETVYVPLYDPIVYGAWLYPDYPPYDWYPSRRADGRVLWFAATAVIGTALWARWDWNRRQVAVDSVRFNRFSRSRRDITTWQHDPLRRRGAPYKAPALAAKFGDTRPASARRGVLDNRAPIAAPVERSGKRQSDAPSTRPDTPKSAVSPRAGSPSATAPRESRPTTPRARERTVSRPTQGPVGTRRAVAAPRAVARQRPEVRRQAPAVARPAPSRPAISRPAASRPAPSVQRASPPPRAAPRAAERSPGKPAPQTKSAPN